jgi:hypothetical protein
LESSSPTPRRKGSLKLLPGSPEDGYDAPEYAVSGMSLGPLLLWSCGGLYREGKGQYEERSPHKAVRHGPYLTCFRSR